MYMAGNFMTLERAQRWFSDTPDNRSRVAFMGRPCNDYAAFGGDRGWFRHFFMQLKCSERS